MRLLIIIIVGELLVFGPHLVDCDRIFYIEVFAEESYRPQTHGLIATAGGDE